MSQEIEPKLNESQPGLDESVIQPEVVLAEEPAPIVTDQSLNKQGRRDKMEEMGKRFGVGYKLPKQDAYSLKQQLG